MNKAKDDKEGMRFNSVIAVSMFIEIVIMVLVPVVHGIQTRGSSDVIDVTYGGEPIAVRFNARYLLDVLAVAETEQVDMKFRDELSPSIIVPSSSDSFLAVIMPMRL